MITDLSVWNGWEEVFDENDWRNSQNFSIKLSTQTFKPWSKGEPNGGPRENCAAINVLRRTWDDLLCSRKECGIYSIPSYVRFHLRGIIDMFCFIKPLIDVFSRTM